MGQQGSRLPSSSHQEYASNRMSISTIALAQQLKTTRNKPTRTQPLKKKSFGTALLATSFSRRQINQDLIGDDEDYGAEDEDDYLAGDDMDGMSHRNTLDPFLSSNRLTSTTSFAQLAMISNGNTHYFHKYPKTHYCYFRTHDNPYGLSDDDLTSDYTIKLDPENDAQFYELAFSLFNLSQKCNQVDEQNIENDHTALTIENSIESTQPRPVFLKPGTNWTSSEKSTPNSVLSTSTSQTTIPSVPSSSHSNGINGSISPISISDSSSPFGSSSPLHRPRGRAFLQHFSPSPTGFSSSSNNGFLTNINPPPNYQTNLTSTGHDRPKNSKHDSRRVHDTMYISTRRSRQIDIASKENRRDLYMKILRTRFEKRGLFKKNSSEEITTSYLEECIPFELMLQILSYLLPKDLIVLGGVSKSFHYIWTEHPHLWFRYPQNNDIYDLLHEPGFGNRDNQEKPSTEYAFIDHNTFRDLVENPPFPEEQANVILSSWKYMYTTIYYDYNGPWMKHCSFYNVANIKSLEYRLNSLELKVCLLGDCSGKSSWVFMLKEAMNNETIDHYNSLVKKIRYIEATVGAAYTSKPIKVKLPRSCLETNANDTEPSPSIEQSSLPTTPNDKSPIISLSIWDTSGVQRYYSLIPLYLKVCKCIMICFDLSRESSFDNMTEMFEKYIFNHHASKSKTNLAENKNQFEKYLQSEDIIVCICGLKMDLDRNVSQERVSQFLHSYGGSRINMNSNLVYFELSSFSGQNVYNPWFYIAYRTALRKLHI